MGVPRIYRKSKEQAIGSFDGIDLASGIGYKNYYALTTSSGALLFDTIEDAQSDRTTVASDDLTWTKVIDKNFDLTFQKQQAIQGTVFVNLSVGASHGTNAFRNVPVITLRHIDAQGNSTIVAEASGAKVEVFAANVDSRQCVALNIPTKLKMSKNHIFRANVAVWGYKDNVAGSGTSRLYHDPSNRKTTDYNDASMAIKNDTDLKIAIPYVIAG